MDQSLPRANRSKFENRTITAKGEARASLALSHLETLWFNTGTLCNIACAHCYIESSPANERLEYFIAAAVAECLDQLKARNWPVPEFAFTGGEPSMNPELIAMPRDSLRRGYEVLILSNAMLPTQRRAMKLGLLALNAYFPGKLTLRTSIDHLDSVQYEEERGRSSVTLTLIGMDWLAQYGITVSVASRGLWEGDEAALRTAFANLFAERGYQIDARDPGACVIFPEIDEKAELHEITPPAGRFSTSAPKATCVRRRAWW